MSRLARVAATCVLALPLSLFMPTAALAAPNLSESTPDRASSVTADSGSDSATDPGSEEAHGEAEWIQIPDSYVNEDGSVNESLVEGFDNADGSVNWDLVVEKIPNAYNNQMQASEDNRQVQARPDGVVSRVAAAPIEKNPHGCRLLPRGTKGIKGGVMTLHLRTKSGPKGVDILGWKPMTKCTTTPLSITHSNTLYRTTVGGLWYPQAHFSGVARSKKEYMQMDITYKCGSKKSEDWKATTNATIVARNGKTYYASQSTNTLWGVKCGI